MAPESPSIRFGHDKNQRKLNTWISTWKAEGILVHPSGFFNFCCTSPPLARSPSPGALWYLRGEPPHWPFCPGLQKYLGFQPNLWGISSKYVESYQESKWMSRDRVRPLNPLPSHMMHRLVGHKGHRVSCSIPHHQLPPNRCGGPRAPTKSRTLSACPSGDSAPPVTSPPPPQPLTLATQVLKNNFSWGMAGPLCAHWGRLAPLSVAPAAPPTTFLPRSDVAALHTPASAV